MVQLLVLYALPVAIVQCQRLPAYGVRMAQLQTSWALRVALIVQSVQQAGTACSPSFRARYVQQVSIKTATAKLDAVYVVLVGQQTRCRLAEVPAVHHVHPVNTVCNRPLHVLCVLLDLTPVLSH